MGMNVNDHVQEEKISRGHRAYIMDVKSFGHLGMVCPQGFTE